MAFNVLWSMFAGISLCWKTSVQIKPSVCYGLSLLQCLAPVCPKIDIAARFTRLHVPVVSVVCSGAISALCMFYFPSVFKTHWAKLLSQLQKGGRIRDLENEQESFFHDGGIPPGSYIFIAPPFILIDLEGEKGHSYW